MRFTSDDFFHIGAEHMVAGKPCQDYALSGVFARTGTAYAVVSDGCSSGGRTDIGARIVGLTTAEVLRMNEGLPLSPDWTSGRQKDGLRDVQKKLGLANDDMLATCMYTVLSREGGGYVYVVGDGVVAVRYRDGATTLIRFDWANNMPFYPAYACVEGGRESFIREHGGDQTAPVFTGEQWVYGSGGVSFELGTKPYSLADGVRGVAIPFDDVMVSSLDCIALFTDGVCRVDGMDWKDAALQLLAFKTVAGAFAKRRMIRFIQDSKKIGRGPLDDIAYAVIRIESAEKPESAGESV